MAANEYVFFTNWKLRGTCQEVTEILGDAESLKEWWPAVYLDVKVLNEGGPNGVGKQVELFTKGWLPYTLRWRFELVEAHHPHGFTIRAFGDLVGTGNWTLEQNGEFVHSTYEWRIHAEKGLLKHLSFALKPVFEANHQWAMARGEESLKLELHRRRACTPELLNQIPPPPQPISTAKAVTTLLTPVGWLKLLRSRRSYT
ncbi:MAG: SRPBCC family protein [Myxococcaceae bacterium]